MDLFFFMNNKWLFRPGIKIAGRKSLVDRNEQVWYLDERSGNPD
jgi:hypothetical protein